MNAVIENAPNMLNSLLKDAAMLSEFQNILDAITQSVNEVALRPMLEPKYQFFKCGFSGSHLWVHQKSHNVPEDTTIIDGSRRIVFVPFDSYTINS